MVNGATPAARLLRLAQLRRLGTAQDFRKVDLNVARRGAVGDRHKPGIAAPPGKGRDLTEFGDGQHHRSEEHASELQSLRHLVCRLLLEKKNKKKPSTSQHR